LHLRPKYFMKCLKQSGVTIEKDAFFFKFSIGDFMLIHQVWSSTMLQIGAMKDRI
jgi:hypothetical protein